MCEYWYHHNIPTSRYGFGTRRVVHAVQSIERVYTQALIVMFLPIWKSHVRTHHHTLPMETLDIRNPHILFAFLSHSLSCTISLVSSRALEVISLGVRTSSDRDSQAGRNTMGSSDWWLHIPPSSIDEPSLNRLLRFESYLTYSDEANAYLLPVSMVDAGEGAQRTRRLMSRGVIIVVQAVHHSLP